MNTIEVIPKTKIKRKKTLLEMYLKSSIGLIVFYRWGRGGDGVIKCYIQQRKTPTNIN